MLSIMKTIILCLLFFISAICCLNKQQELEKSCREEVGVSEETVNKVRSSGNIDNPKVEEYLICFAKKVGAVNNDKLNAEFILNRAKLVASSEEEANRIVKECLVEKSSLGQTIQDATDCLRKHLPQITAV